jgi:hypothetical protein
MLIATVPYVGKRLHLDPDPEPDPKLNYGSGSEHANNFGSGRIRIHNPASHICTLHLEHKINFLCTLFCQSDTYIFRSVFFCL